MLKIHPVFRFTLLTAVLTACAATANTPPSLQPVTSTPPVTATRFTSTPSPTPLSASPLPRPTAIATFPSTPSRQPTPSAGGANSKLSLHGQFVFSTDDGGLVLQDANTGVERVLVKPVASSYAGFPSFSPDGKQIAFSVNSFSKDGYSKTDIRVINVDGSDEKILTASEDPKISFSLPFWSTDGKDIYITQSFPIPPSSEHDEIDRISAKGGALHKVIDDGIGSDISPDGKRIIFEKTDFQTFTTSLWVANIDASGGKRIMDYGIFVAIYGARFSPDAQTIVFAESGPAMKKLPGAQVYASGINQFADKRFPNRDFCLFSFLWACFVERAEAHGLPWDLWLVNSEGTKFERLTNIGSDSPVPAWSQDGKYIAYYEATGIYVIDRDNKKIYPISKRGGYGGFDWR